MASALHYSRCSARPWAAESGYPRPTQVQETKGDIAMKKTIFAVLAPIVLIAAVSIGCKSMPGSASSSDTSATSTTSAPADGKTASSVPFAEHGKVDAAKSLMANNITVPAGTPVTVRLQNAVSSASANSGDRFDAVLDAPLVVDGKTLAPAGANVVGKVVAAK